MRDEPIAVTGLGVVSPIGVGRDAFFAAIRAGEHGIRRVERFVVDTYRCRYAGMLPSAWMASHAADGASVDPAAAVAMVAAREAWADARLDPRDVSPDRIAIVLGTSAGGFSSLSRFELDTCLDEDARHALFARSHCHVQTAAVAEALGLRGPRVTISTACTSSVHAIGSARALLLAGDADVVLAGGVDVLVEAIFAGFHAMGAMSESPCAPFSTPVGMTAGEGAGFLVVERTSSAAARGATVRCFVTGFAASGDAHHATSPDPSGAGIVRALRGAMDDAAIEPGDVGWISAHGTGTEANDAAEWQAIRRVFGDGAARVPVSATKSFFGHALGAAGVLELAAAILALDEQTVPPTLHRRGPRFAGAMGTFATGRACAHRHVLKSSSGFGGINAALVVSSAPTRPPRRDDGDDIVVLGASAYGSHGMGGLDVALRAGDEAPLDALGVAASPGPRLDAAAATLTDVRALDCMARHLSVLARAALDNAGVHLRGALRDRCGLLLGAPTLAWDTNEEFWNSVRERGFERVSVPAFSRIVMNAPAGAVSRAIGCRGHTSVVASGPISGALAAIEGAHTLSAAARRLDLLVVGSAYEMGATLRWDHARRHPGGRPAPGENGACLVLARRRWAIDHGATPRARIRAAAIAGPTGMIGAIARVAGEAQRRPRVVFVAFDGTEERRVRIDEALAARGLLDVPRVDPGRTLGYGWSNDACALVAAVERLRDPDAGPALVVADAEDVGSAVLAFDRDRR